MYKAECFGVKIFWRRIITDELQAEIFVELLEKYYQQIYTSERPECYQRLTDK